MSGLDETSLTTYQNFDGSNTTLLLRSFGHKPSDNTTLTAGFGASTNFNGTNCFVLEGKAKYKFDDNFSAQFRSRNSFSARSTTFQQRLSLDCSTSLTDNVSIYADPYVATKYNCHQQKFSVDTGLFAGAKYKINENHAVFVEGQKYNGLKGGAENWGINVGYSHTF